MAEKKRKRDNELSLRPAKKVNFESAPTVKVSFVPNNEELCPVIASAPGLSLPSNTTLKPYKKRLKDTRILPPGAKVVPPYELLVHSSEHPKVDYTGREEVDGTSESLLKHYIGVFDPSTNELKIVEARKLVVRTSLRRETQEMEEIRAREAGLDSAKRYAQRNELGIAFGTKKAKKAIVSLTENAITGPTNVGASGDAVANAVLKSMAETTASMPARAEMEAAVDAAKPRPRANLSATTPAEVYTPESLIGREILAALNVKEWQDAAKANKEVKLSSRFAARRLQMLGERGDVKKLKVLRYILLLLSFYDAARPVKGGGRRLPPKDELASKLSVSSSILDALKRNFTSKGEMSKWHVDLLITNIAASALIVDNYEVDVFDLREDLRLENKQITQYFHEVGCKVGPPTEAERTKYKVASKADAVNHRIAKLKIPLSFPKQRVGAKRK